MSANAVSNLEMMEAGTWIGEVMRRMIAYEHDRADQAKEDALRALLNLEREERPEDDAT